MLFAAFPFLMRLILKAACTCHFAWNLRHFGADTSSFKRHLQYLQPNTSHSSHILTPSFWLWLVSSLLLVLMLLLLFVSLVLVAVVAVSRCLSFVAPYSLLLGHRCLLCCLLFAVYTLLLSVACLLHSYRWCCGGCCCYCFCCLVLFIWAISCNFSSVVRRHLPL